MGAKGFTVFVAPDGDDSNSGIRAKVGGTDGPLATLQRARQILREEAPRRGGTVSILPGDYRMEQTLELDEEDSGRPGLEITYSSRGGPVRLLGGRVVSGFRQVSTAKALKRLPVEARASVVELDLHAAGITDLGRLTSRGFGRPSRPSHMELYFGGRRMTLARWPNNDYAKITAAAEQAPAGNGHGGSLGRIESGFIFKSDRPARWGSPEDIWVHGYWAWDWANTYERVESIDPVTGLVRTLPPHGIYGIKAGQRLYFLNILEELDSPGEYFVDERQAKLYFWPPSNPAGSEAALSVLESPIIRLIGASHVTIRGLTLEYGRGNGMEIEGGKSVTIAGCTLRNLGNNGIVVKGGERHTICSSDIHDIGDAGIRISGGDRKSLAPCGHAVDNNHIWRMGQWSRCYQPAVLVEGVGMRVSHNLIHDGPHSAIQLSGNDNLIEYNHIHHVCGDTGDVGAFYMGRDWTERGNVVRHNFFHDTMGGAGMGSMAVYLDDCASGTEVRGNVFLRCTRAAFIGGGRDNAVVNNIFVDCEPAVMIDGRGMDPGPVWHGMVYATMKDRLLEMGGWQPPYGERYPRLLDLKPYYAQEAGVPPEGNTVVGNICLGGSWLTIHWHARPEMVLVKDNMVGEDPGFVDAEGMDFTLREDSPALMRGFQPIPFDRIGVYEDRDRCLTESGGRPRS